MNYEDTDQDQPRTHGRVDAIGLSWPTTAFHSVYHIGSLDPSHKGQTHNRISQEGNGLSVSVDPDAWRQIARLGGYPTWELTSEAPRPFLDVLSLTPAHWAHLTAWARAQGFVEPCETVAVSWYDSDEAESEDDRCEMIFSGPNAEMDAQAELTEHEGQDARLEPRPGWSATTAMNERIGFSVEASMAKDMALSLFTQDVLLPATLSATQTSPIQGLWWEERLDVHAYSAPRGVILRPVVATWAARRLEDAPVARQRQVA